MNEKLFEVILDADDIDRIDSSFGYAVEGAELADNEEALKNQLRKQSTTSAMAAAFQ